ncbi:MAG TPA: leucyl/phenylalanyl-tRNA--protein transferase [Rubrivivax sp.]
MLLHWIDDNTPLPPTSRALGPDSDAPGLLAAGGGLSTARLEEAYRHGVFPWFSAGQPVLWWSPDPRMVLPVTAFKLSRSFAKSLRRFVVSADCEIRVDSAFDAVIHACATTPRHGQDGTWIVPAMVHAYSDWHQSGHVHSIETWIAGRLVGGLYAVSIGRMVFGESMFAHQSGASKIALAALVCLCREHGVPLIDCQQNTRHLASLGAREMSRRQFEQHLQDALQGPEPGDWTYHDRLWAHLIRDADMPGKV